MTHGLDHDAVVDARAPPCPPPSHCSQIWVALLLPWLFYAYQVDE